MKHIDPRDNPWSDPRSFGRREYIDPRVIQDRRTARRFAVGFAGFAVLLFSTAISVTYQDDPSPILPAMLGMGAALSLFLALMCAWEG